MGLFKLIPVFMGEERLVSHRIDWMNDPFKSILGLPEFLSNKERLKMRIDNEKTDVINFNTSWLVQS